MPEPLHGRHAVITGGGSGIGAAIAEALALAGAAVTLIGRDPTRLAAKAALLPAAQGIAADVTDQDAVLVALRQARQRFGPVAILINNAGVAPAAPFLGIDRALWRSTLAVNLDGAFFCAQAALPDMLEGGWGRVVSIASTAGLVPYKGVAAYVAAKHAVIGLTRAMALEFASRGITVNAVCPGYTETDMARAAITAISGKTGRSESESRALLAARNPQGRLVAPGEVADTVLWLCGPGADAVTGQAIAICGGEVMH
jgi:NAD(P)-dependent dehydrogenase (short-subunit alcohol dehydrogenase family)